MYKALISFSGKVSMTVGEVREISDQSIVDDLLKAGYIEKVKGEKKATEKKEVEQEEKPVNKKAKKKVEK